MRTKIRRWIVLGLVLILACLVTFWQTRDASRSPDKNNVKENVYYFRTDKLFSEHFRKHGHEFNYETEAEYLDGANAVINDPDSLQKNESEDGDRVFYLERTGGIVFVSGDGFIRTYFKPDSGKAYFDKQ